MRSRRRSALLAAAGAAAILATLGTALALTGSDRTTPGSPPSDAATSDPVDEIEAAMHREFPVLSSDEWTCEEVARDGDVAALEYRCTPGDPGRSMTIAYLREEAEPDRRAAHASDTLEVDDTWGLDQGADVQGPMLAYTVEDGEALHYLFWDEAPHWTVLAQAEDLSDAEATAFSVGLPTGAGLPTVDLSR